MESGRDDFIIAIRSAFLKKSTQQKFSLLTLIVISIFIITLSSLDFKIIKKIKSGINEIVYRSSFIVSIPENFIKETYFGIKKYSNFYNEYQYNIVELRELKSKNISIEIVKSENKELKELIEDYRASTNKILAKVIVDHQSPFLKTVIINKGTADNIKMGTNVFDRNYLVGRVIEVNYKSSRVLLLSDLNSNVPISIIPGNIQAIITGNSKNSGQIKYTKDDLIENIEAEGIAYTSGAGSIFKSGIPVGKIIISDKGYLVNFYSDFAQLKYVFAEVETVNTNKSDLSLTDNSKSKKLSNTEKIKLNILKEEIEIMNDTNKKLFDKNQLLNSEAYQLNLNIIDLQSKINTQKNKIEQNELNKEEFEFLKLNLIYSSKCQKTIFKKGYKVGTKEYRDCIYRKGKQ